MLYPYGILYSCKLSIIKSVTTIYLFSLLECKPQEAYFIIVVALVSRRIL